MPYSSGGIVTKGSGTNAGITIKPDGTGDIQQAMSVPNLKDVIALCKYSGINRFSIFKPCVFEGWESPTRDQISANHFFVKAAATTIKNNLLSMSLDWDYEGADQWCRVLDFDGYYHQAPEPFLLVNGSPMRADLISGKADPAMFYMLMRSGPLANKAMSEAGIGQATATSYLDYCMTVEDIGFYASGTYHSLLGAQLGMVFFNSGGTAVAEVWATKNDNGMIIDMPVSVNYLVRETDMYNIPTSGLSLSIGTYTGVACARKEYPEGTGSYVYLLPYNQKSGYPARVTFNVGGIENYKQQRWGVATSGIVSSTQTITTTASTVYVTMRLHNSSGFDITIYGGTTENGKFTLKTTVSGSIVDGQTEETIDINREQPSSSIVYPASGTSITIPNGTYGEIVYAVTNIWAPEGGSAPARIQSGSVSILSELYYQGTDKFQETTPIGHRALTVTYGT